MSKQVQVDSNKVIESFNDSLVGLIDNVLDSIQIGVCPYCTNEITLGTLIKEYCTECMRDVKVEVFLDE